MKTPVNQTPPRFDRGGALRPTDDEANSRPRRGGDAPKVRNGPPPERPGFFRGAKIKQ